MKIWDEVYHCIKERSTVLEIGCGIGDFVRFLASKGMEVTGIDPYASPHRLPKGGWEPAKLQWLYDCV